MIILRALRAIFGLRTFRVELKGTAEDGTPLHAVVMGLPERHLDDVVDIEWADEIKIEVIG